MSDIFTGSANRALTTAKRISREMKQNYAGTEHILLGLLKESDGVASSVLNQAGVDEAKVRDLIRQLIAAPANVAVADKDGFSPKAEEVIANSKKEAMNYGDQKVGTEHLLIALVKVGDCVATRLLNTLDVNLNKLFVDTLQAMGEDVQRHKEELKQLGAGANSEVSPTPTLDHYSRDLTALAAKGALDPCVGRENEIGRAIQILSRRTKNNPCLIGEPGVGKTAIAEGLALRIVNGQVPSTIAGKRLVTLDLSGMVAGSKYRGEFEERIKKVMNEVINDGNILLFLDEIHTIIGAGGAEGSLDAANILKPALSRGELQLIGSTTISEYRKYIEKDAALERRFQPVMVEEPTAEEAVEILKGLRESYEDYHGIRILDEAIEAAVKLSTRYINDRFLPDKAIDLVDEAASRLKLKGLKTDDKLQVLLEEIYEIAAQKENAIREGDIETASTLYKEQQKKQKKYENAVEKLEKKALESKGELTGTDIAHVVAMWTKIPVEKVTEKENKRLLKLDKILHERVVGQEEAVAAVAKAVKRSRAGLKDPKRPMGSFLFLGPTGVGKTELSKALAEALFGDENALIRVDMSEFMESHSVSKMIGSPPGYVGYDEGGQLAEKVRRNPYSVVLFDEIEKAHPDVFNVLLQVLDDGHITDSKGRKVSFKNTIIIMTSNAGAQRIIDPKKLGFTTDMTAEKNHEDMKRGVMEEVKRIFKPEFLNRIDETIVFHALTETELSEIVTLLLKGLGKRAKEQLGANISFSKDAKQLIAEKGTDKKYGARPLKRAIQTMIEDRLSEEILAGNITEGSDVKITVKNGEIHIQTK